MTAGRTRRKVLQTPTASSRMGMCPWAFSPTSSWLPALSVMFPKFTTESAASTFASHAPPGMGGLGGDSPYYIHKMALALSFINWHGSCGVDRQFIFPAPWTLMSMSPERLLLVTSPVMNIHSQFSLEFQQDRSGTGSWRTQNADPGAAMSWAHETSGKAVQPEDFHHGKVRKPYLSRYQSLHPEQAAMILPRCP